MPVVTLKKFDLKQFKSAIMIGALMLNGFARFVGDVVGDHYVNEVVFVLKEELSLCKLSNHPYGFLVFSFPTLVNGYKIRVHIWPSGERHRQLPVWPVHSHNGDLHSYIIRGAIENVEYEWFEEVDGPSTLYAVGYNNEFSLLSQTKIRGRARSFGRETIREGESYCLVSNGFHESIVCIDESASTFVLLSDQREGSPYVVGTNEGSRQYMFNRKLSNFMVRQRYKQYCKEILKGMIMI